MIDETLEKQYVIGKLRPDLAELMEAWTARSERFRNSAQASYDNSYGEDLREKVDIFHSGVDKAPLLVYLHGGYWQRGDKSIYSFIAKPFVENGVDVAIVSYPLCPQVSLTSLVDSVRRAFIYLFHQADALSINRDRINICGNSAGGHLVAMMLATRWAELNPKLPVDLVKFGVPVSALYQLEPLRHTTLNEAVGLDADEARLNSPQFLSAATSNPILAAVGGRETPVFFEQLESFAQQWQSESRPIEKHVEADADHFDIIERIGDDESEIFKAILQRLQ